MPGTLRHGSQASRRARGDADSALVRQVLRRGATVIATSHYDALKTYAATTDGVAGAAFGFDAVLGGHVRVVDAGHAVSADGVERWFLGVMSSGFDSQVNERANVMTWPTGQARYLAVADLAVDDFERMAGLVEQGLGMLATLFY